VCAALLTVVGTAMASAQGAPTIQSDKGDYAPGELVTLTGSGWVAGESVNINVNDDAGQTWNRNVNVTADASGNISDSFNLPEHFVATYSVTATGASGTATTSFTDGNVTVRARAGNTPLAVTFPAGAIDRYNDTTCSGSPATGSATSSAVFTTNGTNDTYTNSGVTANHNNSEAVLGEAPSSVTVGTPATTYKFTHWTADSPTGLGVDSTTGCISRNTTQTNNPAWNITANYARLTTTALTSSSNPSTYGDNVTFTATVTGSGGTNPTAGQGTVTFKNGGNVISGCTAVGLSGNTATCTTSVANANLLSAAASPHSITAEYSGTTTTTGIPFAKSTSDPLSQVVDPKALTVTGITANNKVYDGDTSATLNFTNAQLNGVLSGDVGNVDLDTSGYTADFSVNDVADKNVANGKAVTVSGLGLSGTKASNYTLTQPTGLTADITVRSVTASITAEGKTFDGTRDAVITGCSLNDFSGDEGKVATDDVICEATNGAFATADAGENKDVSADVDLSGDDSGNYVLTSDTASTTANIARATPTIAITWNNSTYNGNANTASATATGVLDPPDNLTPVNLNYYAGATATGAGSADAPINAGTYTVRASIAQSTNYEAAHLDKTITIARAAGSVTINNLPSSGTVGGSFTPAYTKLGDGTTSTTSNSTDICTVSGTTVNFIAPGTCKLQAHVAQGTNHLAADGAEETIEITSPCEWSRVLQPLNQVSSASALGMSAYKQGSRGVVPVKFQLSCNGNLVDTAAEAATVGDVTRRVQLVNAQDGTLGNDQAESVLSTPASTTNLFRFDDSSDQYIYNLGVKELGTGVYGLTVSGGGDTQLEYFKIYK
jgi:hypothetical protein